MGWKINSVQTRRFSTLKKCSQNYSIVIFENVVLVTFCFYEPSLFTVGIFVTEQDDEVFNEKVEQATDLLCKQKRLYEDEERALRVLREEEAEDFERIEVEKRKRRKQRGKLRRKPIQYFRKPIQCFVQHFEVISTNVFYRVFFNMISFLHKFWNCSNRTNISFNTFFGLNLGLVYPRHFYLNSFWQRLVLHFKWPLFDLNWLTP